ncbi:MAG: tRNA uridine(34) 5-carboxymethylaminomethyl modification radical SAM/GNAT enzyme Elp3 [Promethearchaeota archaeon]
MMKESNLDEQEKKISMVCRDIIDDLLSSGKKTKRYLNTLKARYCKKHGLSVMPKDAKILEYAFEDEREILLPILRRRKTRTLSGVSIIAVMTKPLPCPGECVYCPGRNSQPGEAVAQSYTGKEPAAMRSLMYNYDPFKQVSSRIRDLEAIGHVCDKIELIVMGGTFLSTDIEYQRYFVKGCIEGVLGRHVSTLHEAKRLAENSTHRIIGITYETRPDYCKEKHVDAILEYGGTRIEIGLQTIYDDVYDLVKRGHDLKTSQEAIRISKDAGLKVCLHVMPNLPGSSISRDREMFNELFKNELYRPDYLKIYPCLVIGGTTLEQWWREGKYKPYSVDSLIDLLADVKASIPEWVRIQRVQRDIPAYLILDGVKKSNLRELIWKRLDETGRHCGCIRCREYGFASYKRKDAGNIPDIDDLEIKKNFYAASGGEECFISAINPETNEIFGYLRLRKPSSEAHRVELNDGKSSIVRELRIVGELVPVSASAKRLQVQHRGLGKKLMSIAEDIAKTEFNSSKLLVIAGIGARPYFYQLGFLPDGPYVSKSI